MAREFMERHAADNAYLHKDFHAALSVGLSYLEEKYGDDSVRTFLRRATNAYYAPLQADLRARGLVALKEHFESIYRTEGGEVEMTLSPDELVLRVAACPAVSHMKAHNQKIARTWSETTRTVNEALCEGTEYSAELLEYDDETGRSIQRFYRRSGGSAA